MKKRAFLFLFALSIPALAQETPTPAYTDLVRRCADTLIDRGRDHYGAVESPLFMSVLDATSVTAATEMPLADGLVRTEGRLHRRNIGGCDLWEDQSLLRVLYRLSEKTGAPRYKQAADDEIGYFFEHCRKPSTGLLAWGTHLFWDAFKEAPGGDQDGLGPHETLIREPFWELMWQVDPEGVRRQIEGMWEWHVCNKDTGQFNRHDDKSPGCDFAFMGSELIYAFAFLHEKTEDPVWAQRSKLLANYHWLQRNKATDLAPDSPALWDRYDGTHCFTTLAGPHASLLLRSFALSKDSYYLDVALGHLRAYDKYGWDPEGQSYWGMLTLEGRPVKETEKMAGYDAFQPRGHVSVWRTILYSYEFPIETAQTYAYAAELTGEDQMKEAVRRWAQVIEADLPAKTGRRWRDALVAALPPLSRMEGTYAENYGRAISFFLRAHQLLGEERYLANAKDLAADAVAKLHHPASGLFLGHPAKGTYEATDGVGYLLYALLELDSYPELLEPNF